jgi:glutamine---fructose-6-phosphate transaminase (isomerizing)
VEPAAAAAVPHLQQEIREQPQALARTLADWLGDDARDVVLAPGRARSLSSVRILGCGSAAYAGMVGAQLIEGIARVPAHVELASEFRGRDPLLDPHALVLAISQSGETADTLAALRAARERGALGVAVTNTRASSLAREADAALYTQAGRELAIPSTKCFTAQVVLLHALALELARVRRWLHPSAADAARAELRRLPDLVKETLELWPEVERIASRCAELRTCIFLGRGVGHPIALEAALKLKETAYVHADAYAAGELRHGPMALVGPGTVAILIASTHAERARLWKTAADVRGHGATVIALAARGDACAREHADHLLSLPEAPDPLAAVLAAVPLQIFAYQMGVLRGCDVDRPRNLAKSVAVE